MSENYKKAEYFQDKNPYNPYNLKKKRTIHTILGLQNKNPYNPYILATLKNGTERELLEKNGYNR